MAERTPSVTMKDVAREAGVALGTVSKVINGIPVGESYRIKVEEAIKRLNYRVNSYAKGMKSGKTNVIAVLVPNLVSPYFCWLVNELSRALNERGQRMMLYLTEYNREKEQEYVLLADQQKVDGIICLSYNAALQIPEGISFVSIDRHLGANIPCVASDNYGGGRLAAQTLYRNGCRNLAFLRVGSRLTNEPNKRRDGFFSECEVLDVPCTAKILDDGMPFSEFVDFLHSHFHDGKLDFDGIFCVTDALAHQMIHVLEEMGLRVPEDVQVIGFDGVRTFGDLELHCSTIVQPVRDIARTCVDLVLLGEQERMSTLTCLPVSYAWGGTTKE